LNFIGQDPFGSYIGTDVSIKDPENINSYKHVTEEACCCVVVLLQQYGLVLVNMSKLEFGHIKTFNLYDGNEGGWHLKCVLEL